MLSCLKATELTEKKLQGRIGIIQSLQLKMHTSICKTCKTYEKQSGVLEEVMKRVNSIEINKDEVDNLKTEILKKINLN
jgi:uncharacterized 2Fe-2S/4Fe-4S cluster protein (DUF4445 family)